ncbi:MAG: xylose isomerase [Acidobacteria bacterium]|nr:MAG: xylose isomerase [Acidobacteriota bacterium]
MRTTRREFTKRLSGAVIAAAFAPAGEAARLPIAFSTLGCPAWDMQKILNFAEQHGFTAIEFRGLQGNLDLPSHSAFALEHIAQTKREILSRGLRVACVSSSASLHESDPEKRSKTLADARRFIDLASSLNAPYVRVFGSSPNSGHPVSPSDDLKARVAAGLRELGDYADPRKVTVIIESHDDFTASASLADVLHRADSKSVGLLWDAHHTFAESNEDPKFTVRQLGPWIRHTHLKDSVGKGGDRKYVLTGRGDVPIKEQIEALRSIDYKGFYCFEWEKVWHPDLEDPEIAFADYARAVADYLR